MNTSSLPSAQPRLNGPALTPEAAERLRVLLEAFCALLTAIFPFKSMIERRMAPVWDWLDRAQLGGSIVPVAEDCAALEVAVVAPALEQIVAVLADGDVEGAIASVKVTQSARRVRAPSSSCSDLEDSDGVVLDRGAITDFFPAPSLVYLRIGAVWTVAGATKKFAKNRFRKLWKAASISLLYRNKNAYRQNSFGSIFSKKRTPYLNSSHSKAPTSPIALPMRTFASCNARELPCGSSVPSKVNKANAIVSPAPRRIRPASLRKPRR